MEELKKQSTEALETIKALEAARKKLNSKLFAEIFINEFKVEGPTFFYKVLKNGVFPDPIQGKVDTSLKFLNEVGLYILEKEGLTDQQQRTLTHFMTSTWIEFLTVFLSIGDLVNQIRDELQRTQLFQSHPNQILVKINAFINQKLSEEAPHGKNPALGRFASEIQGLNAPVSFNQLEHVLIDGLDIFTRYTLYQTGASDLSHLDDGEVMRVFLLCQMWEGCQNTWNKFKLHQVRYVHKDDKRMLVPVIGTEASIRRHAARIRFDRMIQEQLNLSHQMFTIKHIEGYFDLVRKIARQVKQRIHRDGNILGCLSKKDLESLRERRYLINISEKVALDTIFHDINLEALRLDDEMTLKGVVDVFQVLRIFGEIVFELNKDTQYLKQRNDKNLFSFSTEQWERLFRGVVQNPVRYLNLLTYNKERKASLDIWCTPFVKLTNGTYFGLPHILSAAALHYISEKFVNAFNPDANSKLIGDAFENLVVRIFEGAGASVFFGKVDGYEFDCLAFLDGFWFLVEAKRTSTVSSPHDADRADTRIQDGIDQVLLRTEYLLSEKGKEFRLNHPKLKYLPEISTDNLLKFVCTNIYEFSGTKHEDIYLTDKILLNRFVNNEPESFTEANVHTGESKVVKEIRPRANGKMARDEVENFFMNPIQITLAQKSSEMFAFHFPVSLKKDESFILFDVKFSDDVYMQKLKEYADDMNVKFDPNTRIV